MKSPNQIAIEALPRYDHLGALIVPDDTGDYLLRHEVLAAITPPAQGSIDADGLPPLPEPVCTKPASGQLFDADQMRAYALADRAARQSAAPTLQDAEPAQGAVAWQCRVRSSTGWHWGKWRDCDEEQYRLITEYGGNGIQEVRALCVLAPTPLAEPTVQGSVDTALAEELKAAPFNLSPHAAYGIAAHIVQRAAVAEVASEDIRVARHAVFNLREFRAGRSTFPGEALDILERALDRLSTPTASTVNEVSSTPPAPVQSAAPEEKMFANKPCECGIHGCCGDSPRCLLRLAAPTATSGGEAVAVSRSVWRDKLRWSKANTDYHGLIAFTGAQLKHFVSMLLEPPPSLPATDAASVRKAALAEVEDLISAKRAEFNHDGMAHSTLTLLSAEVRALISKETGND